MRLGWRRQGESILISMLPGRSQNSKAADKWNARCGIGALCEAITRLFAYGSVNSW
jgi:hypothetical protein